MTMKMVDVTGVSNVENITTGLSFFVSVPSLKTIAKSKLSADANYNENDLNKKVLSVNLCHLSTTRDRLMNSFDVSPKVTTAGFSPENICITSTPCSNTTSNNFLKTHIEPSDFISIANAPSTPENTNIDKNISTSNSISSSLLHPIKINASNSIIKSLRSRNLKRVNSFEYKSSPTKARLQRQWKQQQNLLIKQQKIKEREEKQFLKLQKIKEKEEKKLIREQIKNEKLALKQIKLEKPIKNTTNEKVITTKKIKTPDKAHTEKVKVYNQKKLKGQPENNKVSVIKFCPKPLHKNQDEQQSNHLIDSNTQLKPITNLQLTSASNIVNNINPISTMTDQVKPIFNIKKPKNYLKEQKTLYKVKNVTQKVIPTMISTTLSAHQSTLSVSMNSSLAVFQPPTQPLVVPLNSTTDSLISNQLSNTTLTISSNPSKHLKTIKRKIYSDKNVKYMNKKANLSTDPSVITLPRPSSSTNTTTSQLPTLSSDLQTNDHQIIDEKIRTDNPNILANQSMIMENNIQEDVSMVQPIVQHCDGLKNKIIESNNETTMDTYNITDKETKHNENVEDINYNVINSSKSHDYNKVNNNDDHHISSNSITTITNSDNIDVNNNNASKNIKNNKYNTINIENDTFNINNDTVNINSDTNNTNSDTNNIKNDTNNKPYGPILKSSKDGMGSKKKVRFHNVEVYYFNRIQGFSCIPSQGGITIGMSDKHCEKEEFHISAYTSFQRQHKQQQLLLLQQPIYFNQQQLQHKHKNSMKGQDWQQKQPQQYFLPQHFSQHCFFNNSQNFFPLFTQSTFTPPSFSSSSAPFQSSAKSFVNMPLLTNTYSFPFTSRPYNHFNHYNHSITSTCMTSNNSVVPTSVASSQKSSQNATNLPPDTFNLISTISLNTVVAPTLIAVKDEKTTTSVAEEINTTVTIPKNIHIPENQTLISSKSFTSSLNIITNDLSNDTCKSSASTFPASSYTSLKDCSKIDKKLDTQLAPPPAIMTIMSSLKQSTNSSIITNSQATMIQLPSQTNACKDDHNISPSSTNSVLCTGQSNTQTVTTFSTICTSDFHKTDDNKTNQNADQTADEEGAPSISTTYFVNNDNVNMLNNNRPIKRLSLWRFVKDKNRDNKASTIMTPVLNKRSRKLNSGNKKENEYIPTNLQPLPCLNALNVNVSDNNETNSISPLSNNIDAIVSISSDTVKLNNMPEKVVTSSEITKYTYSINCLSQHNTTTTSTININNNFTTSSLSTDSFCVDSSLLNVKHAISSCNNNDKSDHINNDKNNSNNNNNNNNNINISTSDNFPCSITKSNEVVSSNVDTTINPSYIKQNNCLMDIKSDINENTGEDNEPNTKNTSIIMDKSTISSNEMVSTTYNNYYYDEDDDDDDDYEIYSLQPLPVKQRRNLLKLAGLKKINNEEREECKRIRISREECGCACKTTCVPETCLCIQNGIMCQVDRMSFPCGCSLEGCGNPEGRVEFNAGRVKMHLVSTLVQLQAQKAKEDANNTYPPFNASSQHSFPPFIPSYSHSPTYYQYPQQYAFDGFVAKYMPVELKTGDQTGTGYISSGAVVSSSYNYVGSGDYSKDLSHQSVSENVCSSGSFHSVDSSTIPKSTNHCKITESFYEGFNKTELNKISNTDAVNTIVSNDETFCKYKTFVNQKFTFKNSCQYTPNNLHMSAYKPSHLSSTAFSGPVFNDSCHKTINSQPLYNVTKTLSTCNLVTKDENNHSNSLVEDMKSTQNNVKTEDNLVETNDANKCTSIADNINVMKTENLVMNSLHVTQIFDKVTTTDSSGDHISYPDSMPHEFTKDAMIADRQNTLPHSDTPNKETIFSDVLNGFSGTAVVVETAIPEKDNQ